MGKRVSNTVAVLMVPAILAIALAVVAWHGYRANENHWVYPLDDTYIHLAIAKNLATCGVWGASPSSFAAASSAPLYTLLLTFGFLTTGPAWFWAALLAAAGGLITAGMLAARCRHFIPHWGVAVLAALWALVVIGLPELVMTGMEHTLHIAAVLLLLALFERRLTTPGVRPGLDILMVFAALAAAALRYETLFLIPPITWFLIRSGYRTQGIAILTAACVPAAVMGAVHLSHGAMILPNSLIIKGVWDYFGPLGHIIRLARQISSPYWIMLLPLAAVGVYDYLQRDTAARSVHFKILVTFLFALLCHGALARVDRRYVAFVVACGIWALLPLVGDWIQRARASLESRPTHLARRLRLAAWVAAVCVFVLPFGGRAEDLRRLWYLSQDIYLQQHQMALFFATYYRGEAIALNDIGTTAWLGQNRVVDLVGLTDCRIARQLLAGDFTSDSIDAVAARAGAAISVVYPAWYTQLGGIPSTWYPVAEWRFPNGLRTNADAASVRFYATRAEAVAPLRAHLTDFLPQLPPSVETIFD